MKKSLLIVLSVCTGLLSAQAQRPCGTMQHLAELQAADPALAAQMEAIEHETEALIQQGNLRSQGGTLIVPVVFHILYANTSQNISNARILAQLQVLNDDYASTNIDITNTPAAFQGLIPTPPSGTGIQFCLAQRDPLGNPTDGILRIPTTVNSFSMTGDPIKFTASGGHDAWPRADYLNIWVGNLSGGVLGYAQFPGGTASTDGVALLYSSVGGPTSPGTIASYNLGRTATHEIGHWLNLRHINGDSNCGNDQVADTPPQSQLNFGCPNFPKISNCPVGVNPNNGPNGDLFMNYMDYVDDNCMVMFTLGQSTRMNACLNGTRLSILSSQGCTPLGIFETGETLPGISIYPNPAQQFITVSNTNGTLHEATIRIFNMMGQSTLSTQMALMSTDTKLDISNLSNGIYMVEVAAEGRSTAKRLVIARD